jgi:hypothetical protein
LLLSSLVLAEIVDGDVDDGRVGWMDGWMDDVKEAVNDKFEVSFFLAYPVVTVTISSVSILVFWNLLWVP